MTTSISRPKGDGNLPALCERLREQDNHWPDMPCDRCDAADTIEALTAQRDDLARQLEAAREALEWSIAEIEGRTRYTPNCVYGAAEQRENALGEARATLARITKDRP